MTHVVYTWKSGQAKLYVDNQLVNSKNIGGDLSSWNQNYTFALANEITGDRGWHGTYDLVAVYDRSLDSADIEQNFLAGSDSLVSTPNQNPNPLLNLMIKLVYGQIQILGEDKSPQQELPSQFPWDKLLF